MPVPSDLDQLIHVDLGIRVHELLPQRIVEGHGVHSPAPVLLLETISHIEIGIDRVGIKPGVIGVVVIAQLPPFPGPRRVVQVVDDAVVLGFADFLSEADDADRAVPVGDVLCGILTRPLDLFDGEVARVDPVDSEPFCAGAEAGSDSIVGHVDARHQHGTVLLGQRVDDRATPELQSAAVLAHLYQQTEVSEEDWRGAFVRLGMDDVRYFTAKDPSRTLPGSARMAWRSSSRLATRRSTETTSSCIRSSSRRGRTTRFRASTSRT